MVQSCFICQEKYRDRKRIMRCRINALKASAANADGCKKYKFLPEGSKPETGCLSWIAPSKRK
jgi:hypothetical protein